MRHEAIHRWLGHGLAAVFSGVLLTSSAAAAEDAASGKDFSRAEQLLFISPQLVGVAPPVSLGYRFRRTGTLEPGFEDRVALVLQANGDGQCCTAHTEFLSGAQKVALPDVPAADGNPVILHFLERDVREMNRLTKGAQNYFRKRIRMAIYSGATVRERGLMRYRGSDVAVQEVLINPYLDDPNRNRYDKLARKEYRFILSSAVPGGVYGIRTRISNADRSAPPLSVEALYLDGTEPAEADAGR